MKSPSGVLTRAAFLVLSGTALGRPRAPFQRDGGTCRSDRGRRSYGRDMQAHCAAMMPVMPQGTTQETMMEGTVEARKPGHGQYVRAIDSLCERDERDECVRDGGQAQ